MGSNWDTIEALLPDSMKPAAADFKKKLTEVVVKGSEKIQEKTEYSNEQIYGFLDNGKKPHTVSFAGLTLKDVFKPTSLPEMAFLEVTMDKDTQNVTFGGPIGEIFLKGNPVAAVLEGNKINKPGTYQIPCEIPKGTVFSEGVTLKLVKREEVAVAADKDKASDAPTE